MLKMNFISFSALNCLPSKLYRLDLLLATIKLTFEQKVFFILVLFFHTFFVLISNILYKSSSNVFLERKVWTLLISAFLISCTKMY